MRYTFKKMCNFAKKTIMAKYIILFSMLAIFSACGQQGASDKGTKKGTDESEVAQKPQVYKPEVINEEVFRKRVFDFMSGKEWKYAGDKPCIIDFYADWCAPCRRLAPVIEQLAAEYDGKIYVYKVNTDMNPKLSAYLDIISIPTVLVCPLNAQPQKMIGLYPKEEYVNAIDNILLSEANNQKSK